MFSGSAVGKVILFGEHFVVYNNHGIVLPLPINLTVTITKNPEMKIFYNGKEFNAEKIFEASKSIISKFNIEENFLINIEGNLPAGAGLGWSAAFCVSLTKALAYYSAKKLSEEEIFEFAQEGEKVFHGKPSGIDATIATYAEPILFRKTSNGITKEKIKIKEPLYLLIINSKEKGITKEMVEKVRKFKEKNEELFAEILKEAEEIALKGKEALESGNNEKLISLINRNQELLKQIGVSTPKIDMLVEKCLKLGLPAAKITGSGGGGCIFALCKNKEQFSLAKKFEEAYPIEIGGGKNEL